MKKDLINLISQIQHIDTLFIVDEIYYCQTICYNPEFLKWKTDLFNELNDIQFKDSLIETTLSYLTTDWTGINDKRLFSDLSADLENVLKDIDKYYKNDTQISNKKKTKVFISYHEDDFSFVEDIISKLNNINDAIVYKINSLDDLALLNKEFDLFIIYVLSSNYLDSIKCQNEMGATWVLKNDYIAFNINNNTPRAFYIKPTISNFNDNDCFGKLTELF